MHSLLHGSATAHRSQKYYLDLTHPDANKGTALHAIAKFYGYDPAEVACIGDMTNDVPMFRVAGLSIAMGNAPARRRGGGHGAYRIERNRWLGAGDRPIHPAARTLSRRPSEGASDDGATPSR